MNKDHSTFLVRSDTTTPIFDLIVDGLDPGFETIRIDSETLDPHGRKRQLSSLIDSFEATPEPLIRSWLFAQRVLAVTDPGDTVIVGDGEGLGGVLALGEASKPADRRRTVITAAGEGSYFPTMLVANTVDHLEQAAASVVDWELVQYRYSADLLGSCAYVVAELERLGVASRLAVEPDTVSATQRSTTVPKASRGWAPGPVARHNRTGDVLRAVASLDSISLALSDADEPDAIWSGTTWDALAGIRHTMGSRLTRVDVAPPSTAFVILGDPLIQPDRKVEELRANGVPILASKGSVAKARWPEIVEWEDADDLAALIDPAFRGHADVGRRSTADSHTTGVAAPKAAGNPPQSVDRAHRVSVGIPIFGGTAYLSECVESVLAQTQAPHEVLLIDDGSASPDVDTELAYWARREPDVVRTLRQANRGVCVARNTLMSEMTGDAFLLLDQDDLLHPSFLERTSAMLRRDHRLWAVASWTEFFGEYSGIEAKPPFTRRTGLRENPIISTGAVVDMMVRDQGIEFEPDLAFLYCEDWHFWSQIVAAGGEIGLVPEPLIMHRVHRASGGFQRTDLALRIGKSRATAPLTTCGDWPR